jgi:hypothetical protein
MTELTVTQVALIVAFALVPAVWQLVTTGYIHALWLALAVAAGIFAVIA